MSKRSPLIRLADNPFAEDELGDELAPPEELPEEELPPEEDDLEMGMYKGRRVSGPRTKMAASAVRLARIERAVADQSETVASLARSVSILGKAVLATLRKEDEDEDEDKEDKSVRKGKVGKQYESETDIGGTKDVGEDRTADDETMNAPGLQDECGATELKARVAKDDASGNFGEKDEDIPGNRPAGIDEKDKSPEEYLIQGDTSAGTGPVSKAVTAELDKAIAGVLAQHGIVRKAAGPRPGTGSPEPTVEVDALFERARGMTFRELNAWRAQVGDISAGVI